MPDIPAWFVYSTLVSLMCNIILSFHARYSGMVYIFCSILVSLMYHIFVPIHARQIVEHRYDHIDTYNMGTPCGRVPWLCHMSLSKWAVRIVGPLAAFTKEVNSLWPYGHIDLGQHRLG